MHIRHNLILRSVIYMLWALKAHHLEGSCKNIGIIV